MWSFAFSVALSCCVSFAVLCLYLYWIHSYVDSLDMVRNSSALWLNMNISKCKSLFRLLSCHEAFNGTLKLFLNINFCKRFPLYRQKESALKTSSIIWLFLFRIPLAMQMIKVIISMRLFKCLFKSTNGNNKSQNGKQKTAIWKLLCNI